MRAPEVEQHRQTRKQAVTAWAGASNHHIASQRTDRLYEVLCMTRSPVSENNKLSNPRFCGCICICISQPFFVPHHWDWKWFGRRHPHDPWSSCLWSLVSQSHFSSVVAVLLGGPMKANPGPCTLWPYSSSCTTLARRPRTRGTFVYLFVSLWEYLLPSDWLLAPLPLPLHTMADGPACWVHLHPKLAPTDIRITGRAGQLGSCLSYPYMRA